MKRFVSIKLAGWILALLLSVLVLWPLMERVPMAHVDAFARQIALTLGSGVRRYEVFFTALVVGFAVQEFLRRWRVGGRTLRDARRRHALSPKIALSLAVAIVLSAGLVGHYSAEFLKELLWMASA